MACIAAALCVGMVDWPLRRLLQSAQRCSTAACWAVEIIALVALLRLAAQQSRLPRPRAGRVQGVRLARSSGLSYDRQLAAALWDASADEAGVPRACQLA